MSERVRRVSDVAVAEDVVVYALPNRPRRELVLFTPSTGVLTRLLFNENEEVDEHSIALAPDGTAIAVVASTGPPAQYGYGLDTSEIVVFDRKGKVLQRLAGHHRYASPVFSSDGGRLFYWRDYNLFTERNPRKPNVGVPYGAAIFQLDIKSGLTEPALTALQTPGTTRGAAVCATAVLPITFASSGPRLFIRHLDGHDNLFMQGELFRMLNYSCNDGALLNDTSMGVWPAGEDFSQFFSFPLHSSMSFELVLMNAPRSRIVGDYVFAVGPSGRALSLDASVVFEGETRGILPNMPVTFPAQFQEVLAKQVVRLAAAGDRYFAVIGHSASGNAISGVYFDTVRGSVASIHEDISRAEQTSFVR